MSSIRPFKEWTLRGQWFWPPIRPSRFEGPAIATVIHHSVTNTAGKASRRQAQDIEEVIYGRRFSSRFSMIAYSYVVSDQGIVYEGRGVSWRNGANNDTKGTGYSNTNTISICFAGNYHPPAGPPTLSPTMSQLEAAAGVIRQLETDGHLVERSAVLPHRHVHATACPGDNLAATVHTIDMLAHRSRPPAPPVPTLSATIDGMVLVNDPENRRMWLVWEHDATQLVREYGRYRDGVGEVMPGVGFVIDEQVARGNMRLVL